MPTNCLAGDGCICRGGSNLQIGKRLVCWRCAWWRGGREAARRRNASAASGTIQIELPKGRVRIVEIVDQTSLHTVLELCFAKILCAPKIARFPAATAVPSKLSLHPREPRISRRNARAVYLYI